MNLPDEIIIEILLRLPVKSLSRFKCVCKSWRILLNNSSFISDHYRTFSKDHELLLACRRDNATNKRVISLLRNNGNNKACIDQDLPILNDMFGHVRLIGPSNGIVCLYGFPDNITLWNPILRDFKILPPSSVPRPPHAKIRGGDLGLGFDSITHDIKVLQILFCVSTDSRLIYQVEIYYSNTNSWKKYENTIPANIMYQNIWSTVHKNENFCWWAQESESNAEVILLFDMRKEIFQMTPLPSGIEVLGGQRRITRAIVPMKESIAIIVYSVKEVDKRFDVWVTKELAGNADSWMKVSSIGPLSSVERPLGFWKNGEFIVESGSGELVFYNPTYHETKTLGVYGKRDRLEVVIHKESLFSVNQVHSNL